MNTVILAACIATLQHIAAINGGSSNEHYESMLNRHYALEGIYRTVDGDLVIVDVGKYRRHRATAHQLWTARIAGSRAVGIEPDTATLDQMREAAECAADKVLYDPLFGYDPIASHRITTPWPRMRLEAEP